MKQLPIAIILAIAENGVIGTTNPLMPLPWRLPKDMKFFKKTTTGNGNNIVIMGRKTWDTIDEKYRPLLDRKNIILSTTTDYVHNDAMVFSSKELLMDYLYNAEWPKEIFIAGGLQIYKQFLPDAREIYITRIHENVQGDVIWNDLDLSDWQLESSVRHEADDKNKYPMTFEKWVRK